MKYSPLADFSRSEWKLMAGLYLSASLSYYACTWYAYGGFGGGHPPLWDLEEFFSSTGLKFTVFFLLSLPLLSLMKRLTDHGSGWFLAYQGVSLLAFVVLSDVFQDRLLATFDWVHFFGGRMAIFNDLLAGGFYCLQVSLLLGVRQFGRGTQVQAIGREPRQVWEPGRILLATSGSREVPLRVAEISHLSAAGNYTEAYHNGDRYLLSTGIGKVDERLTDGSFLRVHRSHLVNLTQIESVVREGRKYFVVTTEGDRLPVGKTYLNRLKELRG